VRKAKHKTHFLFLMQLARIPMRAMDPQKRYVVIISRKTKPEYPYINGVLIFNFYFILFYFLFFSFQ
jgi:hypothetical protein